MLAICSAAKLVVFQAPKLSFNAERVSQGTKLEAQPGHKKHSTSLKQPSVSSKEATKGGSSKASTSSKTGHSKKRKESSSQATGGPTYLGVTSEERAYPQLSSGCDASADATAKDQTQSVSEGLETVLTQPTTGKGASSIARQVEEEESSRTFKLDDLAKLVDEDKEDEVHTTINTEIEDTSAPKSSSPSLLPTELKDLPSKFNELTEKVKGLKKQVHELEFELPGDFEINSHQAGGLYKNCHQSYISSH
ncbi:hypothetical protein Tco_1105652 [Tanacetum coccineum]